MSIVSNIYHGLLISALGTPAYATEQVSKSNTEQPTKPATVDARNLIEVVQVLTLANLSQLDGLVLAQNKNPGSDLEPLAKDLLRDHRWMQETLEALAQRKQISMKPEDLTPTSQLVKRNVESDYQILVQIPQEDFRATFMSITIYQYRKILKLYDQIDQLNSDAQMKAILSVFRPMVQKDLGEIEQLRREAITAF
jgi:predicted outer membrane protein